MANFEQLALTADEFNEMNVQNKAIGMWDFWKSQASLRSIENLIRDRIGARVKIAALKSWRHKL